jgi:hypothetical protein
MNYDVEATASNTLRKLEQARTLPLWGLAVRACTSTTTLSAIEQWGYKPRVELQGRITTAHGVNVADIWPEVSHE